jgi:hypothetical protein
MLNSQKLGYLSMLQSIVCEKVQRTRLECMSDRTLNVQGNPNNTLTFVKAHQTFNDWLY